MTPRTFFRVNHTETQQGLWYDFNGEFTGLIHDRFSFCQNRNLKMDFDPSLVGHISAVETIDQLFLWFSREDILRLQEYGFYIHEYRATDYKEYEQFRHYAINQATSQIVRVVPLCALCWEQVLSPETP